MPICKNARFQIREGSVEKCRLVIDAFVAAVRQNEPGTLLYIAFEETANPSSFIHVMVFEDEAAERFHQTSSWVKAFTDALYPETVDGVQFTDLLLVATT